MTKRTPFECIDFNHVYDVYKEGKGKLYFIPDDFVPALFGVKQILELTNQSSHQVNTIPNTNIHVPIYISTKIKNHIPRPPNAFVIYRGHKQSSVVQGNPGIKNREVSREIGKMWKAETFEVKEKYKKLAEEAKKNHKEQHPHYKYKPRRKGIIKRKKKAQTQTQNPVFLGSNIFECLNYNPLIFGEYDNNIT